jgi:hypothetical protein
LSDNLLKQAPSNTVVSCSKKWTVVVLLQDYHQIAIVACGV